MFHAANTTFFSIFRTCAAKRVCALKTPQIVQRLCTSFEGLQKKAAWSPFFGFSAAPSQRTWTKKPIGWFHHLKNGCALQKGLFCGAPPSLFLAPSAHRSQVFFSEILFRLHFFAFASCEQNFRLTGPNFRLAGPNFLLTGPNIRNCTVRAAGHRPASPRRPWRPLRPGIPGVLGVPGVPGVPAVPGFPGFRPWRPRRPWRPCSLTMKIPNVGVVVSFALISKCQWMEKQILALCTSVGGCELVPGSGILYLYWWV